MKIGISAAFAAGFVALLGASSASFGQQAVLRCDDVAAFPFDPARRSAGVPYERLQPSTAITACSQALVQFPNSGRLWFQYGRALERGGRIAEAVDAYGAARRFQHPGGSNNLGELLLDGKGLPKDPSEAEALFREAAAMGYPEAAYNLASILMRKPTSDASEVRRLLGIAAAVDYPNSRRLLANVAEPAAPASKPPVIARSPLIGSPSRAGQAERYISLSGWNNVQTEFLALENYNAHAANPIKKTFPFGACIFGADQSVFMDVMKQNWVTPLKLLFPDQNFIDPDQVSFAAFSQQLVRWDCSKIYVSLSWLNKAVSFAEANRGKNQAAYDILAALSRARVAEVIVSVAKVAEETAVRERLRAQALAETAAKEAEERKEAEVRRLAEQERLRKETEERQEAARKEKQARDDFIAGYRGKGAYWFLFAKVAVPLNKMCVVGEASGAVDSYATREIVAKLAKGQDGPDFTNLKGVGFQIEKRGSFEELVASLTAKSHDERCDFAVAPFDDALSLVSARPDEFGAILARPFVFTRAEAESAEKDAQAEVARKREEQQRAADAEAARQEAQRLRDEVEKRRVAEEYEARKEARRKQDAEEQRVAALNAELERIRQQEAKELAEREAAKRAEQEKQDAIGKEREAKEQAEREAANREQIRILQKQFEIERAGREAAMRVEATKREQERIGQEQEAKERAEREAAMRAERERQELVKREQQKRSRSSVVNSMTPNIESALKCPMSDGSEVYFVRLNKKSEDGAIFDIESNRIEFISVDKWNTTEVYKKSASFYSEGVDYTTEVTINRTTLEARVWSGARSSMFSDTRMTSKVRGQCIQWGVHETADKIVEIKENRKSEKEEAKKEEEKKKQKALSDRKI
jgi:hypothetical protein